MAQYLEVSRNAGFLSLAHNDSIRKVSCRVSMGARHKSEQLEATQENEKSTRLLRVVEQIFEVGDVQNIADKASEEQYLEEWDVGI